MLRPGELGFRAMILISDVHSKQYARRLLLISYITSTCLLEAYSCFTDADAPAAKAIAEQKNQILDQYIAMVVFDKFTQSK